jgi:AraC family transcriptional regulator
LKLCDTIEPSAAARDFPRKASNRWPFSGNADHSGPGEAVTVLRSSENLAWPGLHTVLSAEQPHTAVYRRVRDIWFVLPIQPIDVARQLDDGAKEAALLKPGRMVITGANQNAQVAIRSQTTALHVFLNPAIVAEVAHELFGAAASRVTIESRFDVDDDVLGAMLCSIGQALEDPPSVSSLKARYLSRTIAAHTLCHYARTTGAAASREADAARLASVTEYIRTHLDAPLRLADLCAVAGLGRTALIEQIKAATGQTPHQYVTTLRLQRAQQLLHRPHAQLTRIALECGFADQSHFCATFKRFLGITPSRYRISAV